MSQLLVHFETTVRTKDGRAYIPSARGDREGDLWVGWIEFEPTDQSEPHIHTDRETEQASLSALMYWAEGLSQIFLEGALERALNPRPGELRDATTQATGPDTRRS